jgi:RNA polymerase sigma-70 factor (ECF subfamily)
MTRLILDNSRRTRLSASPSPSRPPGERRMLGSVPIEGHDPTGGITFEADFIAQLPSLRRYAYKLTHDREQAMDLVQDTCEKALRFRRLFRQGTNMRAWVLTIMRHHFFDTHKKRADAMAGGRSVPEESSEWAYRAARADQIYFAKEALRLAVERLTKEQASVFWPTLGGATREECAVLSGVPTGTVGTRLHRARSFMRRACAA